jgi:hypothetical protein
VAVNKALPVALLPIPAHRNDNSYNFLPGKLRTNPPAPRVKGPKVLEADAVIVDLKSSDWFSFGEAKALHPFQTATPDPSSGADLQIPPYLQQTFLEAYRRQADPRLFLPAKGELVNLTA